METYHHKPITSKYNGFEFLHVSFACEESDFLIKNLYLKSKDFQLYYFS